MRKIIAAAASVVFLVIMSLSIGLSNTGLFFVSDFGDGAQEYDEPEEKTAKWEFVGNVSVASGRLSRLG